jgi:polysaccharide export outer membrane protein
MSVILKGLTTIALAATFCSISGTSQVRSQPTPVTPPMVTPETNHAAAPSTASQTQAPATDMAIGAGDLLELSVYGAPDFDKKEVRVSGAGDIVLPMIGPQHVEGLTVSQAQDLIARKLTEGQFFNNPQVSIFVKEYVAEGVSVLGEVQKPGVYPLLGQHRLFDAITLAGGTTQKAGKVVTISRRTDPNKPITIKLGSDVQGSTEGNVEVFPGDTIVVGKAGIVYVVGDVKLPGGFVMEHGTMTVLQALALAQGANPTAALDSSRLIRNVDGQQNEVPIQLKEILSSKSPDVKVQPDDIVFIPNSAAKSAMRRSLEMIVQTASGMAIYHPY